MECRSTKRKDRNYNDAETRQSTGVLRLPTRYHCIELNETMSNSKPHENGPWCNHDVVCSTSLERSRSERVTPRPRWDGVSVWVPNTASTVRRSGQRHTVPQYKAATLPSRSTLPSVPTTSTTANTRWSRGTKLLSAAGSTLVRAWNRRPTKLTRYFSASKTAELRDETSTLERTSQHDQKSKTLPICRKCRGRIVASPTVATDAVVTKPEVALPTVTRDLETESGYLIGRATSNSPNDVISCRTLPSTSPEDATADEDDQRKTKDAELQEGGDVECSAEPSADCSVVKVTDALHSEDLLTWKLSLMDRAEERLLTSGSWFRDNIGSSDEDEDCHTTKTTTSVDVENRVESPGSEFSFENDFERALELETSALPTTATVHSDSDSGDVPQENVNDVEKLFEAKLDELLRTRCDVKTDQLQCVAVTENDQTQLKQQYASLCDTATGCREDSALKMSDYETLTNSVDPTNPSTANTAKSLRGNTNSTLVQWRSWSSLPHPVRTSTLPVPRSSISVDNKSFDLGDGPTIRRSSLLLGASKDDDNLHARVGSTGYRFRYVPAGRGTSLPLRDSEPSETNHQSITERPSEHRIVTESTSTPCNCLLDDKAFRLAAENSDLDGNPVTWRQLRGVVDDAVVELVDDLLTMLRGVDVQKTSELTRTDVDRLRRRLLRNVRTALRTSSEPDNGSTIDAKDKDELQQLRRFVGVLLDRSNDDDVRRIAGIKKYVMTCPAALRAAGNQRWRRQRHSSDVDSEVNVFVLRHGVRIDGLHVSVAGRDDLPVNAVPDSRIQSAFVAARRTLKAGDEWSQGANNHARAAANGAQK